MARIKTVNTASVVEDTALYALVPEMTSSEYASFTESIKQFGIKVPIHVRSDMVLLDGRHRLRAARELGIERIDVIIHSFDKEASVAFVRDTAVERRSLTAAQRIDVVLKSEELLGTLTKTARENSLRNLKQNSSSTTSNDLIGSSSQKLAEVAKSSSTMVSRMQRLKRESPDKYSEVVAGDKTISGAYFELPPTRKRNSKRSAVQEEQETTVVQPPTSAVTGLRKLPSNMHGYSAKQKLAHATGGESLNIPDLQELSAEETAEVFATDNLGPCLQRVSSYMSGSGNFVSKAVEEMLAEDKDFLKKSCTDLEHLLHIIKTILEEN